MIIGSMVATSAIVFNGAGIGALGNFALPTGNLVESVCWLMALLVRLRTERTRARERLLHEATHDPLTGLPNRAFLMGRLVPGLTATVGGADARACCGLVLMDLDRFKAVNNSLGYAVGDEVLAAMAGLLGTIAPPPATVVHLGADRFAVLLRGDDRTGGARVLARRVLERLREPVALGAGSVHVRASLGVVARPLPGHDITDILRDADSALNLAKIGGGNRAVEFEPVMRTPVHRRFRLEQDMVEALRGDQFQVFFQPIVALADRRPVGMETLIRWHHPERGWIAPGDFIPVAEETGLIVPIGTWVLGQSARHIREWKAQGRWREGFYLSVNLSGNQLLDDDLLPHVDTALAGLAPGELRLELTETTVVGNVEALCNVLPALRERGIPLYMDDFGTGYSSLSYLNELPFDVLKIDRSFITAIGDREESQVLVRTVLAMARAMNLQVVAEGIETADQAALLFAMGGHYGQGYHFARPMPAALAADWLG